NKFVHGKKQGLWSEFNLLDTVDFKGEWHVVLGQHYAPKSVIAEGLYVNNERQGFWKTYWILQDDSTRKYYKGNVQTIIEYRDNVACNLVVEYYPNGNLKVIGHYETFPVNVIDTIQVPDWK
ncbi:hypothetical protein, partial [Rhizobium leguminosarum]|uniref:hypothetical protein n=1 Tax=Rhizobium leguminosarum TaxID=384 RepID=UPI003F97B155